MGDRRVASLAHVADERLVLHADGAETKLLLGAALGADGIGRETGQLLNCDFCLGVRHSLAPAGMPSSYRR